MKEVIQLLLQAYRGRFRYYLALALIFVSVAFITVYGMPENIADRVAALPYATSALFFFVAMVIATVIAPIAILPAVPAVAVALGPWQTALLSIAGWTFGAVVAFLVARGFGKPILEKFVNIKHLAYYENALSAGTTFWGVVVLRMLLPLDILSYAIGAVSTMPLFRYTLATMIGVAPASIAFSYLGHAITTGEYLVFAVATAIIVITAILAYRGVRNAQHTKDHVRR